MTAVQSHGALGQPSDVLVNGTDCLRQFIELSDARRADLSSAADLKMDLVGNRHSSERHALLRAFPAIGQLFFCNCGVLLGAHSRSFLLGLLIKQRSATPCWNLLTRATAFFAGRVDA